MTQTKSATDAIETGSTARALAVGAFALGAAAIGAIAVGAMAIGHLQNDSFGTAALWCNLGTMRKIRAEKSHANFA